MRPSKVLEHLCRFAEDPEEAGTLTKEEVQAALTAEGIDPDALSARLRERLAQIRSDRVPSRARRPAIRTSGTL